MSKDFLDELIEECERESPGFRHLVEEALARRELARTSSTGTPVTYQVNVCDPTAYGEDFADAIDDAVLCQENMAAACDGLITALQVLGHDLIDMDEHADIVQQLVELSDTNLARLRNALVEADQFIAEEAVKIEVE